MKVKIFTEGGRGVGYGHISRCRAIEDEIKERGIDVKSIIYDDINWMEEEFIKREVKKEDICIIDSYIAKIEIYELIQKMSKKTIYIDDTNRLQYPEGTIINPSILRIEYKNKGLVGNEYIIVRKGFIESKEKEVGEVKEVLVTVGGSDIRNILPIIKENICKKYKEIQFNFVTGVSIQMKSEENIKVNENINSKQMRSIMDRCDIAIVGAGQTLYELIKVGLPFIPIKIIDNQENNVRGLKKYKKDILVIEYNDEEFEKKIEIQFKKMMDVEERKKFLKSFANVIDGHGVKRIVDEILEV